MGSPCGRRDAEPSQRGGVFFGGGNRLKSPPLQPYITHLVTAVTRRGAGIPVLHHSVPIQPPPAQSWRRGGDPHCDVTPPPPTSTSTFTPLLSTPHPTATSPLPPPVPESPPHQHSPPKTLSPPQHSVPPPSPLPSVPPPLQRHPSPLPLHPLSQPKPPPLPPASPQQSPHYPQHTPAPPQCHLCPQPVPTPTHTPQAFETPTSEQTSKSPNCHISPL